MQARNERHLAELLGRAAPSRRALFSALAQTPPADLPPPEFTWREYAIFLLTIAAQIEHSLMVQYLYAAWSLGGPQVPEEHHDHVAGWRQTILGIAKEEMGHLVTVQNLLRFLDAPLALDREDLPWDSKLAPYPFVLERLTRATLAKYVVVESPQNWPPGVSAAQRQEIEKLASGGGQIQINRVGALYERLIEIFGDTTKLVSTDFHPETFPLQASWDEFARGYGQGARGSSLSGATKTPDVLVMPVAARSDAVAALKAISQQGEAPGDAMAADDEASHFRRFLNVFRGFPADGDWEATLDVPPNPVGPTSGPGPGQTLIEDPQSAVWASLFNIRYRMLLNYLAHAYTPPGPSGVEHRQGVVINRMFGEMYNLRAIASLLTKGPLKAGSDKRAGAPFQMPYTLQLPNTDAAFWRRHIDLIDASALLLRDPLVVASNGATYARSLLGLDADARTEMQLYADSADVRTGARRMTGALT